MPWRLVFALALVLGLAPAGHAGVWQRARPDGTVEYTNLAPRGGGWSSVKEASRLRNAGRASTRPVAAPRTASTPGSTVWSREHEDGTLEFTNVTPVGARWKVLFRTGPGKAAAVRGTTDIVPPRDGSAARFSRFDEHIRDQQAFYGIPQPLMRAIIKTESDYDPNVVSRVGAQGLTQLMPDTARMMGVANVWDPRQNIMGGARYLQTLAKRFCKTPAGPDRDALVCSFEEKVKVLAGYHAGPGAVEKYGGMPPYETTRTYVTSVLQRYEEYRRRDAAALDLLSANP